MRAHFGLSVHTEKATYSAAAYSLRSMIDGIERCLVYLRAIRERVQVRQCTTPGAPLGSPQNASAEVVRYSTAENCFDAQAEIRAG